MKRNRFVPTVIIFLFIISLISPISSISLRHSKNRKYLRSFEREALNQELESFSELSLSSNTQTPWVPVPSNSISILFDEHHGGVQAHAAAGSVSLLGGLLISVGYRVETNIETNLTANYLSNYDVLVISFPEFDYSQEEITAVLNFIQSGGSVIFVGISNGGKWDLGNTVNGVNNEPFDSRKLNPLTTPLGVTYAYDFNDVRQVINSYSSHPIGKGNPGIYILDVVTMNLNTSNPIEIIANATAGKPLIAARSYGSGKAVFLSTNTIFSNILGDPHGKHNNNTPLLFNIFDWASGVTSNPDYSKPIYEQYLPIPVLPSQNTPDGILRRYDLYKANLHVHSVEGSSDAGAPVTGQIDWARKRANDFLVLTDHESDTPTASWQPALDYMNTQKITDLDLVIGIEADTKYEHFIAFPITSHVLPTLLADMVAGYKSQGGYMFFAHPSRAFWNEHMADNIRHVDTNGVAGFEIIGAGISGDGDGGIGEFGLNHPFYSASDSHSFGQSWTTLDRGYTMVFAKNWTDQGLIDSILGRRSVAYCGYLPSGVSNCNYYMGDTDWLNEFGRRNSSVANGIAGLSLDLIQLNSSGTDVSQSQVFLANASTYQSLQNLRLARQSLIKAMNSIYDISIGLSNLSSLTLGDNLTLSFDVKDLSGNTVSGSNIQIVLYDSDGTVVDAKSNTLNTQGVSTTLNLSPSGSSGEFLLWYNISVGNGFYEERQRFSVNEPEPVITSNSTTTTVYSETSSFAASSSISDSSSSLSTTNPTSSKSSPGFSLLPSLIALISVMITVQRRRKRKK